MTCFRRYLIEFSAAMAAYIASLAISNDVLIHEQPQGLWRQLVALLPMLPACAICFAIVRNLQRVDELQRRLQFEALALSFAATALLTFSYGFLEGIGYPKLSMFVVWPIMCAFWIIGVAIGTWRYR